MYTCNQWVSDDNRPSVLWVHCVDLMAHLLKKDPKATAYKEHVRNPASDGTFGIFSDAMSNKNSIDDDFQEIVQDVLCKPKKIYKPIYTRAGNFDVDQYVNRSDNCFQDYKRQNSMKRALSILLDFGFNWSERFGTEMVEHHKDVYRLAFKAYSEKRPCRVIAAVANTNSENRGNDAFRIYIVLKDFSEPLFPGVWGCFVNNQTSNATVNVIMDYLHGTHDGGNGSCIVWNVTKDITDGSEIIVLKRRNAKLYSKESEGGYNE